MKKGFLSLILVMAMLLSFSLTAFAAEDDTPILALGANLSEEQKATVLSLLGVDPAELDSYHVIYVTNDQEHQYLPYPLCSFVRQRRAQGLMSPPITSATVPLTCTEMP